MNIWRIKTCRPPNVWKAPSSKKLKCSVLRGISGIRVGRAITRTPSWVTKAWRRGEGRRSVGRRKSSRQGRSRRKGKSRRWSEWRRWRMEWKCARIQTRIILCPNRTSSSRRWSTSTKSNVKYSRKITTHSNSFYPTKWLKNEPSALTWSAKSAAAWILNVKSSPWPFPILTPILTPKLNPKLSNLFRSLLSWWLWKSTMRKK